MNKRFFLKTTAALTLASGFAGDDDALPIRTDARVWLFAMASTALLATAVGLPPAWHAMRVRIVDALAGR